jgi:hypothetical protein
MAGFWHYAVVAWTLAGLGADASSGPPAGLRARPVALRAPAMEGNKGVIRPYYR